MRSLYVIRILFTIVSASLVSIKIFFLGDPVSIIVWAVPVTINVHFRLFRVVIRTNIGDVPISIMVRGTYMWRCRSVVEISPASAQLLAITLLVAYTRAAHGTMGLWTGKRTAMPNWQVCCVIHRIYIYTEISYDTRIHVRSNNGCIYQDITTQFLKKL